MAPRARTFPERESQVAIGPGDRAAIPHQMRRAANRHGHRHPLVTAHTSRRLYPRESDLWDRDVLIDPTVLALKRVQLGAVIAKRVFLEMAQTHGPSTYRTRGLIQFGFGRLRRKRNHRRLPRASQLYADWNAGPGWQSTKACIALRKIVTATQHWAACGPAITAAMLSNNASSHGPAGFTGGRGRRAKMARETTHSPSSCNILQPLSRRPTWDRRGVATACAEDSDQG